MNQKQCRPSRAVLRIDGEDARVPGSSIPSFVLRIKHGPVFMPQSAPRPHFTRKPSSQDCELENSVRSSLQKTGYHQLCRLDVAVEDGQVRLSGRLPQFYLLQLAQQAVMKTEGVMTLDHEIEIVRN